MTKAVKGKEFGNGYFIRKREAYFPLQFVALGYLLILFGVYLLTSLNLWGLMVIAGGIAVSFTITGIQIDFNKGLFRDYLGLFQIKLGKWKDLGKVEYVTVFIEHTAQNMHLASISSSQVKNSFSINLVLAKSNRISIGNYNDRAKAINAAAFLVEQFDCKFLDYTSGKPVWVKL